MGDKLRLDLFIPPERCVQEPFVIRSFLPGDGPILAEAATSFGKVGSKTWIYKGEVLKAISQEDEPEDIKPIEVMVTAEDPEEDAVTPDETESAMRDTK